MTELQKEVFISYLKNDDIEIIGATFLAGGNVSKDAISIQYYCQIKGEWHLNTDVINPTGEISTRSVKASRR